MSIIAWVLIGLIAGAIAKRLVPGRASGGILLTMLLGIAGAMVGGWLGNVIFGAGIEGFFSLSTWISAVAGSCLLLFLYGALTGRR
jgi:uncharacterized membrane protein YeaQ/YmgE (transglycosylase-associated protein family)